MRRRKKNPEEKKKRTISGLTSHSSASLSTWPALVPVNAEDLVHLSLDWIERRLWRGTNLNLDRFLCRGQ
jgi:hypothetical protein